MSAIVRTAEEILHVGAAVLDGLISFGMPAAEAIPGVGVEVPVANAILMAAGVGYRRT